MEIQTLLKSRKINITESELQKWAACSLTDTKLMWIYVGPLTWLWGQVLICICLSPIYGTDLPREVAECVRNDIITPPPSGQLSEDWIWRSLFHFPALIAWTPDVSEMMQFLLSSTANSFRAAGRAISHSAFRVSDASQAFSNEFPEDFFH
jgi:hypothetical protein